MMVTTRSKTFNTLGAPEGALILNDGRLLLLVRNGSYTITPDEYGDYYNGTASSLSLLPGLNQTSYGSSASILRDGRVVRWGGHQQYDSPWHTYVSVYDPITNVWTNVGSNEYAAHSRSSSILRFADGRFGKSSDLQNGSFLEFLPSTNQLVSSTLVRSVEMQTFLNLDPTVNITFGEAGWAQLPDDSFVMFPAMANAIWPYNFENTFELFKIQSDKTFHLEYVTKPSFAPTDNMYSGVMPFGKNSASISPYSVQMYPGGPSRFSERTYLQVTGAFNNLAYENPANIWAPKFGKVLVTGGGMGELYGYDPASHSVSVLSQLPQTAKGGVPFIKTAQLRSPYLGMSLTQLLTQSKIELQLKAGNSYRSSFLLRAFIYLSSGQFIVLEPTTVTKNGGNPLTSTNTETDIIELNGPYKQTFGPRPDTTNSVTASDVYISEGSDAPVRLSAEAGATILPSGNYLVGSDFGTYSIGGLRSQEYAEWDGFEFTIHDDGSTQGFSWDWWNILLPTGEVLAGGQADTKLYFRSFGSGQHEAARPIITEAPRTIRPGRRFTLKGKQLWGIHVGAQHGDDFQLNCNNPVVYLRSKNTNRVYYLNVVDSTSWSINPMNPSSLTVDIPFSTPIGDYDMFVVSAGNPSRPAPINIGEDGYVSQTSFFDPF